MRSCGRVVICNLVQLAASLFGDIFDDAGVWWKMRYKERFMEGEEMLDFDTESKRKE